MTTPVFPASVLIEYPIREKENWKTLVSQSEGGVERRASSWTRPIREWDLIGRFMPGASEADVLKNFFRARRGPAGSFLFVCRNKRSIDKEYVGTGDGSQTTWRMPFKGQSAATIYRNGVEIDEGADYSYVLAAGPAGEDLLVMTAAPAASVVIEADGVDAYLVPLVRLAESYEDEYVVFGKYNARYRIVEVKEDVVL